MAASWRRWRLAALVLVALACGTGCDVVMLPYFLLQRMMGQDSRQPPQVMKLASDKKDQEVKVVVMAYSRLEAGPEFLSADQDLTELLVRHLQENYKAAEEKVVVVSPYEVRKYKEDHPDWYMDLKAAGKHFHADYVIYLQIESLSLYKPGSHNTLYHAQADIEVSLFDIKKEDSACQKYYRGEYPRAHDDPVEDRNQREFQQTFLDHIAEQISWYFSSYDYDSQYPMDM